MDRRPVNATRHDLHRIIMLPIWAVTWHTDAELERLDEVLMALPEDNDPMILTEFDGFCAGLITCPEMISPSAWLSQVWGRGGAPEFKDLSEMQAMIDLVMAHHNRVAALLMMQGEYYPVMDEDRRNGDILCATRAMRRDRRKVLWMRRCSWRLRL